MGADVVGFVVIDDNFRDLFERDLPEGHFVETVFINEDRETFRDFDGTKEGLTEMKVLEAFECLKREYSQKEVI